MKKTQIMKSLNNIPQGLEKLEPGMTFQVKKSNANKIDIEIMNPVGFNKKTSAKMRRSVIKGGETFIPMRSAHGSNSIQFLSLADAGPTGIQRKKTMGVKSNGPIARKIRSLSNDKIEEFESEE